MIEVKRNREISDFLYRKLEGAKKSIHVAVAWFTDPELSKILLEKKKRIDVRVILYNDQINCLLKNITAFGDNLYFSNISNFDSIMHHKFCIIDDEFLITGSYNWTVKARRFNRENILCISDKSIIEEYKLEFDNLLKNSSPQSVVNIRVRNENDKIEDLEILELEKEFNEEIYSKIDETAKLKLGVDVDLAYRLVAKHTPVVAAKKLAESHDGKLIQSGLRKVTEADKLFLSFEESIIKTKYKSLFISDTRKIARDKLKSLGYFSNILYRDLWNQYE